MIGINGNGNEVTDDDCKITINHVGGFGNNLPEKAKYHKQENT